MDVGREERGEGSCDATGPRSWRLTEGVRRFWGPEDLEGLTIVVEAMRKCCGTGHQRQGVYHHQSLTTEERMVISFMSVIPFNGPHNPLNEMLKRVKMM